MIKYLFVSEGMVYQTDEFTEGKFTMNDLYGDGWKIIRLNTTAFEPCVWNNETKKWEAIEKI